MKKITAICLVCTLFLSQYGRFLAYVQCAISGLIDPNAPCECERQVPESLKVTPHELPPPKGMNVSFEEFYLPAPAWKLEAPGRTLQGKGCSSTADYTHSPVSGIFRPPRV